MDDLIWRADAIDALTDYWDGIKSRHQTLDGEMAVYADCKGIIKRLPSAQPKIIRCKDCKYAEEADEREWLLCHWYGDQWNEEDHWCSHAERNVDE